MRSQFRQMSGICDMETCPTNWPVRLSARTSPFHGGKTGSTPVRATIRHKLGICSICAVFFCPKLLLVLYIKATASLSRMFRKSVPSKTTFSGKIEAVIFRFLALFPVSNSILRLLSVRSKKRRWKHFFCNYVFSWCHLCLSRMIQGAGKIFYISVFKICKMRKTSLISGNP